MLNEYDKSFTLTVQLFLCSVMQYWLFLFSALSQFLSPITAVLPRLPQYYRCPTPRAAVYNAVRLTVICPRRLSAAQPHGSQSAAASEHGPVIMDDYDECERATIIALFTRMMRWTYRPWNCARVIMLRLIAMHLADRISGQCTSAIHHVHQ